MSPRAEVVIVDAVRSPIGKRGGGLSTFHSADLLAAVLRALIERSGLDPAAVGQVGGGCISQVGEQACNITRTAWLTAGLPSSVAATSVDCQCGSSQQAASLMHGLLAGGLIDIAIACGVEVMSRTPLGSNLPQGLGKAIPRTYFPVYEYTTQFEAAERIAEKWGITRRETDVFGYESQTKADLAWSSGRFESQVVGLDAPDLGSDGRPIGSTHRVEKDEGLRETTLEGLASLKPVARPDGVHTAGSSSQISDGAAALLMMTRERADALRMQPLARVVDSCLVGSDPVLMLTGPIDATQLLLKRNKMVVSDIDVFEINEAFASVVLAWEREVKADHERVNPNGGAIAMGHALGSTGCVLLTKAIHEMHRSGTSTALVSMCCGGGLATGTLLERV